MSYGLIGTGMLGGNLALNISKKNELHLYNRTFSRARTIVEDNPNMPLICHKKLPDMIESMKQPRTIVTMLPHGSSSTMVIDELCDILSEGDTIMDGANEYFSVSESRGRKCSPYKIGYLGLGIAGGKAGVLNGPTVMVGGSFDTFKKNQDFLNDFSGNLFYMGEEAGSGHYTKMVHNGIEYGLLQGMSDVFAYCNYDQTEFQKVLRMAKNTDLYGYLIENADYCCNRFDMSDIDGECHMNSTGMWCSMLSLQRQLHSPVIISSVVARVNSRHTYKNVDLGNETTFVDYHAAVGALLFVFASAFLEGFELIEHYGINCNTARRAWSRGTIIQCKLLEKPISNLIFTRTDNARHARDVVNVCNRFRRGIPSLSAAVDSYHFQRNGNRSTSLLMAQRFVFGGKEIKNLKQ